jgi:hypothetical protein
MIEELTERTSLAGSADGWPRSRLSVSSFAAIEVPCMAWDRRGYYRRNRKVNGNVVTEYVGGGVLGQLAAQIDADERARRDARREADREARSHLQALDKQVNDLDEVADLLARAALLAAGFHQHHRGPWRRQRATTENVPGPDGPDPA